MTTSEQLDVRTVERFADRLRGDLLQRDDEGYDDARTVWNGAVDKRPALIARCAGTADVMQSVEFAREHDLDLSVKASGHMTTGHAVCDDGLVVDLSSMDGIRANPAEQTVRVQAGATWRAVNHETLPFRLVPPGTARSVGVAGFTLGGGQGYLTRTHGLASDLLREVDVVTADGDLVTASEDTHEDLFWALRGGGGNFGIVTSFEFECVELNTEFTRGELLYSLDQAPDLLRLFRDTLADAPDELFPILTFMTVPEGPEFPSELHGQTAVAVTLIYVGEPDEAETAFEPFFEYGDPSVRVTEVRPYQEVEDDDEFPPGIRQHWESVYLDHLSEDLIETLVAEVQSLATPTTMVSLFWFGGAVSRYESDATAYAHRDAPFLLQIATAWSDPDDDEVNRVWTRDLHETVSAYGTGGEYLNLQTDDGPERARAAYGDHFDRLAEIKSEWDPDNVFRVNQNIAPND